MIEGTLTELRRYDTDPERPSDLMAWLKPLLSEQVGLTPEARAVAQAFGKGSLTFLFHAIRRLIAAGRDAGWPERRIVECCANQVRGLDVHPVAVTLARVTWLLALGPVLSARPSRLTFPVFLGDAMQC